MEQVMQDEQAEIKMVVFYFKVDHQYADRRPKIDKSYKFIRVICGYPWSVMTMKTLTIKSVV